MRIRINPVYGKELKMKVRSVKFALPVRREGRTALRH